MKWKALEIRNLKEGDEKNLFFFFFFENVCACSTCRMLAEKEQRTSDSSLAQLLKTDQVVSRKYNDHGGGLVNPVQVLGQIPRKSEWCSLFIYFIQSL